MASDLESQTQLPHRDEMEDDLRQPSSPFEQPTVNGVHQPAPSSMQPSDLATGGKLATTAMDETHSHLPLEEPAADISDPNPAGPSPVENVESGIAPISDFVPKDALNLSHPTPPPDEPLVTGAADVDVEMANVEDDVPLPAPSKSEVQSPPPPPALVESTLVRPREDDLEDEPAPKRARTEESAADVLVAQTEIIPTPVVSTPVITTPNIDPVSPEAATPPVAIATTEVSVEPVAEVVTDVEEPVVVTETITEPVVEALEEPAADVVVEESIIEPIADPLIEPAAAPVVEEVVEQVTEPALEPMDITPAEPLAQPVTHSITETVVEPTADGDVHVAETRLEIPPTEPVAAVTDAAIMETPIEEKPVETPITPAAAPLTEGAAVPAEVVKYDTVPMTAAQRASLLEKTKNLKKTKNSSYFLKPVDPVALGIPTYFDIIKTPMDLTTLETKLKEGKYTSVQDFVNDFDLIISNSRRFNGDQHAVTQAGFSMEAYFRRVMQGVPKADEVPPVKAEKKRSPSIPREKRRESRAAAQPAPAPAAAVSSTPTAAATTDVYALHADGTPQIRRQSSIGNRPARAIKPPQNREIPYAKPKRKEHQLELRFCEHILDELRDPKYAPTNAVFMYPVDPVALNIPHYRQVVKNPMDLSTMQQKLKSGQYGTAAEFKKDFDLIIKNCLLFNPVGNPVRDLGIQFQRQFEEIWANKDKWERKNQPASNRASSASGDEESAADDEEEEEEVEEDESAAKIRALQKQLADMQNALNSFHGDKQAKTKKTKASGGSSKKQSSSKSSAPAKKAAPKPAPKPKKPRSVSYEDKQEISEAVNRMTEAQLNTVTDIITKNDSRYRDMEEMELEIDDLTVDVQVLLLEYVRKIFGNPKKVKQREPSPDDAAALDDDDYEEKGGPRGGKRKKHRPMGKKEQQDTITSIKNKLAAFNTSQVGTSGSESPTNSSFVATKVDPDTSGDEETEESEEE